MASVQSASYGGRYLKLTVWESEVNVSGNYSTVSWKLESIGGTYDAYSIFNWGVWVNAQTIYAEQTTSWESAVFPAIKGSRQGTIRINHKEDGSADSVPFKLKGCVYYNRNEEHTGSISLTKIDRYATFTKHEVKATSEHSITIEWSIDALCDLAQYSINGGAWTGSVGTPYTLNNLDSGTSYTIKTRVRRQDSQLWTESSPLIATTKDSVIKRKIDGIWKDCVPYIKVGGTWKKAIPYQKVNNVWKDGVS